MKILTVLLIALLIAAPAVARGGLSAVRDGGYVPAPRLIAPTTSEVNLEGKDSLVFEWSPHEGDPLVRDYYDFRLYKGYSLIESALVCKEKVPADTWKYAVKTDLFQDREVYTWSLRQVYTGSKKSARSTSSFRVTLPAAAKPQDGTRAFLILTPGAQSARQEHGLFQKNAMISREDEGETIAIPLPSDE